MEFFNKFPYTDFHELNLDWVLKMLKELDHEWDEFKVLNTITLAGTWDITKNYPKYAIVEDSGNGYLSIKPVPAGISINNLDYWIPVGTYSAAISSLNTRMTNAEGDITTLQGTVSTNTTDINTLKGYIPKINASHVTDGTIICIGDSYLEGYSPDGNTTPWGTLIRQFLGKSANTVKNYADGGCGFVAQGNNSKRFDDLIQDAISDSSFNNNDVSLVIIGGGWNDARVDASVGQIVPYATNCSTLIKNNFPYAHTVVAFIGTSQSPETRVTYDKLYKAIMNYGYVAESLGMPYIYNIGIGLKASGNMFSSDGLHPNQEGQNNIARSLINYLGNGNTTNFKQFFDYTSLNLYVISDNNNVMFDFFGNQDNVVSESSFTCNGATQIFEYDINDIGCKPLLGASYFVFETKAVIRANNKYYIVDCFTQLTWDGKLRFFPHAMADDHSNYLSLTNVDLFKVTPQIHCFPRFMM